MQTLTDFELEVMCLLIAMSGEKVNVPTKERIKKIKSHLLEKLK